jgi:hypothetical protein
LFEQGDAVLFIAPLNATSDRLAFNVLFSVVSSNYFFFLLSAFATHLTSTQMEEQKRQLTIICLNYFNLTFSVLAIKLLPEVLVKVILVVPWWCLMYLLDSTIKLEWCLEELLIAEILIFQITMQGLTILKFPGLYKT